MPAGLNVRAIDANMSYVEHGRNEQTVSQLKPVNDKPNPILLAAWNDFYATAKKQAAQDLQEAIERANRLEQLKRTDTLPNQVHTQIWHQTIIDKNGNRKVIKTRRFTIRPGCPPVEETSDQADTTKDAANQANKDVKKSVVDAGGLNDKKHSAQLSPYADSPKPKIKIPTAVESVEVWSPSSSPPPDCPNHPAYFSYGKRIRVKLPPIAIPEPANKTSDVAVEKSSPSPTVAQESVAFTPTLKDRRDNSHGHKRTIIPPHIDTVIANDITKIKTDNCDGSGGSSQKFYSKLSSRRARNNKRYRNKFKNRVASKGTGDPQNEAQTPGLEGAQSSIVSRQDEK